MRYSITGAKREKDSRVKKVHLMVNIVINKIVTLFNVCLTFNIVQHNYNILVLLMLHF